MTSQGLREIPVAIGAGDVHLLGIKSEPAAPAAVGALVLPAHGTAFGGRTRFALRLARRLADAGLRTLRFDYEGTGESSGGVAKLEAVRPAVDDAEAAAHALIECGHDRIVLIGYCYGARVALAVAERLPEVVGVALISPPVEAQGGRPPQHSLVDVVRGAFQPARWAGLRHRSGRRHYQRVARRVIRYSVPRLRTRLQPKSEAPRRRLAAPFVSGMTSLAEPGTPTLLIFGESDRSWSTLRLAREGRIDRLLDPGASSVELSVIPGAIHGLRDEVAENAAIEMVTAWAARIDAGFRQRG